MVLWYWSLKVALPKSMTLIALLLGTRRPTLQHLSTAVSLEPRQQSPLLTAAGGGRPIGCHQLWLK